MTIHISFLRRVVEFLEVQIGKFPLWKDAVNGDRMEEGAQGRGKGTSR